MNYSNCLAAFTEDIQHSLAAGMNAHVSKPVEVKVLEKTISSIKTGGGAPNRSRMIFPMAAQSNVNFTVDWLSQLYAIAL